ncbi:hypothetical protein ABEB36_002236 [Hypothenemus hampei]|uniref:RRP15-like protein n=1 Tax=Hypothenemus hampei TaxID=57062 RepID=A0ABD1F534_HYPHA
MTVKAKNAKVLIEDSEKEISSDEESVQEDSQHDASSDSEEIDDESKILLNEGWADAIAKILKTNKPKKKKSLVLSKAKKLTDPVKKVRTENYEIATADGQIRKEQTVEESVTETEGPPRKKKREIPNIRVKPNILEKDRERTLQKIATKGVVQLFNAVRTQQKDISKKLEEAGSLEVRKEKVLKNIDKRKFLDLLMGEKSTAVDEALDTHNANNKVDNQNKTPSWNVLRDDFLQSAKIKDWDKETEPEQELENEPEQELETELEQELESD